MWSGPELDLTRVENRVKRLGGYPATAKRPSPVPVQSRQELDFPECSNFGILRVMALGW